MLSMKVQDALDACHEEHREDYQYWVSDQIGSTPLWEVRDIGDGDFQRRACVVFDAVWQPWESGNLDGFGLSWRKVTREKAYEMFPTAFPGMMLKELHDAKVKLQKFHHFAEAHEKWEGDLLNSNDPITEDIVGDHQFLTVQKMRNEALGR